MWLDSLLLCIGLLVFVYFAREGWEDYEEVMSYFSIMGIPIILFILFVLNINNTLTIADRIIQGIAIGVCIIWCICLLNDLDANGITFWAIGCFVVFVFFSGYMFIDEITQDSENISEKKEITNQISWDYSNPQIVITEYMIVGTSDETIIVNVSYNGENTLRSIPFEEITVKYDDSILKPYVYRENTVYTEYDYGEEPPEVLRKDYSTWSKYILCGTKQQIQALFGYEETFDFEQ